MRTLNKLTRNKTLFQCFTALSDGVAAALQRGVVTFDRERSKDKQSNTENPFSF